VHLVVAQIENLSVAIRNTLVKPDASAVVSKAPNDIHAHPKRILWAIRVKRILEDVAARVKTGGR
jgi:hypothetical protein